MARYIPYLLVLTLTALTLSAGFALDRDILWLLCLFVPLAALGVWDIVQSRHSLLRNYPLIAHLRWFFEGIRPEIRQYLIESDQDAVPFNREQRSVIYQRAKNELQTKPFGTSLDVNEPGYEWVSHSITPHPQIDPSPRIEIGGPQCAQPYSSSIFNISAMSFGSLSANAISALNKGAKIGGFAHDTGEGGISEYHLAHGGDIIWEIGSGYFGCRGDKGEFDPEKFENRAKAAAVKMIEVKLSQGAKPGQGGLLPGKKVTPEIAAARDVPVGQDCISPARHPAFSNPIEFLQFLANLRKLSGGKPVGFKLCIGNPVEFMAIVKAMLETGIAPDFIVVDGKEGGTGAAPLEFVNRVGMPLSDGLAFVHNTLIGAGMRDAIKIGASGKLVTAFFQARALALGADWCNSARGYMFALGCIQAQSCHTNHCPVGVATQDPLRQRGLVVEDKAQRVANYHRNTLAALTNLAAACGLEHPSNLSPHHLYLRREHGRFISSDDAFPILHDGALLTGDDNSVYAKHWNRASALQFSPEKES
jgi:glutamate synthase domain-containing protein 2